MTYTLKHKLLPFTTHSTGIPINHSHIASSPHTVTPQFWDIMER